MAGTAAAPCSASCLNDRITCSAFWGDTPPLKNSGCRIRSTSSSAAVAAETPRPRGAGRAGPEEFAGALSGARTTPPGGRVTRGIAATMVGGGATVRDAAGEAVSGVDFAGPRLEKAK